MLGANDRIVSVAAIIVGVAAAQCGLGEKCRRRHGIHPDQRIWLSGQWFNLAGILQPSPLTPDIDVSALIGYPAAQKYLGYVSIVDGGQVAGPPSTIYIRAATGHEAAVQSLLAQTANPEAPYEAAVSQPSDVLTARAAAAGAGRSSVQDAADRGVANGMTRGLAAQRECLDADPHT